MDDAQRLISYLYSFDAREAAAALVALGASAVEPLIAVISGAAAPDLTILRGVEPNRAAACERAAYVLGDIGDARAVEPLMALYARESDRYIRLAAARALGRIGDVRAVDTLADAVSGRPWTPDYAALVDDFARLGGVRAVDPLIHLLRSEHHTYGSAARAVYWLAMFRDDPRVPDGLIGGLRLDAEFSTVQAVVSALADVGGAAGAGALLAFAGEMVSLPPERWDGREDNLSESAQGVVFHVLRTEFVEVVAAIRRTGDTEACAGLERLLAGAPRYVTENLS